MIELSMAKVLPAARKAFDEGRLQAQNYPTCGPCKYAGPCAIGAALSNDEASRLDRANDEDDTSIETLIDFEIVTIPKDQTADFIALQIAHDRWNTSLSPQRRDRELKFRDTLEQLETKYLTPAQ